MVNDTIKNFKGEEYFPAEQIHSELEKVADKIESNFKGKRFDEKINKEKQKDIGFIAVNDIMNSKYSKNLILSFYNSLYHPHEEINSDFSGLYIFAKIEGNTIKYLYTGISRTVASRIIGQTKRNDEGTATWARLIAKNENEKIKKGKIKGEIVKIQETKFSQYVLTVYPINNNFLLHIAEGYIACKFKCKWNSFKTH